MGRANDPPVFKAFDKMMKGKGMSEADGKQFEEIMKGYHDLLEHGRREIYTIEG